MRLKYVFNALSLILKYISLVILCPIFVALTCEETASILPFICASIVSFILSLIFKKMPEKEENFNDLKKTEALVLVVFSWIFFGLISAIPYLFYGLSPLDSLFEAVSGITTTGATILMKFDYPKTIFFWRAMSQWLGGMGIIVLFVAILPQFAVAGRQMFAAEAPGPTEEKITPRIRSTATLLWGVYLLLTILEIIFLTMAKMPFFDAVCNSFATMAAGGFSPNSQSILGYHSNLITWIISIFMFLAGANFALQYRVIFQKKIYLLWQNAEFKLYIGLVVFFSLLIFALLIFFKSTNFENGITNSFFQVISIMTSTGFASVDFNLWTPQVKSVLFFVMFIGGCAGSAGGGIKVIRWLFVKNYLARELKKILHPNAVIPIKIDDSAVAPDICEQMLAFVAFYFLFFILSSFLVFLIQNNLSLALTGSIATLGNIGPGYGTLGPLGTFAGLLPLSKMIFIVNMLVGRLEIIPFLVLLNPETWNLKK